METTRQKSQLVVCRGQTDFLRYVQSDFINRVISFAEMEQLYICRQKCSLSSVAQGGCTGCFVIEQKFNSCFVQSRKRLKLLGVLRLLSLARFVPPNSFPLPQFQLLERVHGNMFEVGTLVLKTLLKTSVQGGFFPHFREQNAKTSSEWWESRVCFQHSTYLFRTYKPQQPHILQGSN